MKERQDLGGGDANRIGHLKHIFPSEDDTEEGRLSHINCNERDENDQDEYH